MAAIDPGLRRQLAQALERRPHLLGRAFEGAAAAEREQGIAAKYRRVPGEPEGDMAARMAGNVHHFGIRAAEPEMLAIGESDIDRRDTVAIGLRSDQAVGRGP